MKVRNIPPFLFRTIIRGGKVFWLECKNIGKPAVFKMCEGGIPIFVRRWTSDCFIVSEILHDGYPLPKSGDIVLDIGANIGIYSLYAAKAGARVIAFEPEEENFALLQRNVVEWPTIEAVHMAVADENGLRKLSVPFRCSTGQWSLLQEGEGQNVHCISFHDIVQRWALLHIDILKMDIEGAEYQLLQSMSQSDLAKVRRIFLEFHDEYQHHHFSTIVRILEAANFLVTVRAPWYSLMKTGYIDAVRME